MKTWNQNDLPECLIGYNGQFASTVWYKSLCEHFSQNFNVGTHYRGLKRFKNCFAASDAVTWLEQELSTKKFKSPMNRNGVVKVLCMMHKIHQVFEDVRGDVHDQETFSDNSRLFRFRDYSIGFDNQAEMSQQSRQPLSQLDNNLPPPPATPSASVKSFVKSASSIHENSTSSSNARTPYGCLSNHRSYEDLPKRNEVKMQLTPPNLHGASSSPLDSRHEKSLSLLVFDRVRQAKSINHQSRRNMAVNPPSIGFNPSLESSSQKKLQTLSDGFSRAFELFPTKNKEQRNDGLMGFTEALESCSSNNFASGECNVDEHDDDDNDDDDDTKSILKTTQPQKNNKENKHPVLSSDCRMKMKKVYRRSASNEKLKKRIEVAIGEESNKKEVVPDNDYKLSLVVSLCKKLEVENIGRILSVDWIDPSIVKKNFTSGVEWLSINMECTSKKDFPENIGSMLDNISSWPLKTYCKFRVGAERCDASVQSMFDAVLNYLESNSDNIFPVHFQQLLVVVHDLCKVSKKDAEEEIEETFLQDATLDLSQISQSISTSDITAEGKRKAECGKKNGRKGRSRYEGDEASDSECSGDESKLLRNHNFTMTAPYRHKNNKKHKTVPYVPPVKTNPNYDGFLGDFKEFCANRFTRDVSPVSKCSDVILDPTPLSQPMVVDPHPEDDVHPLETSFKSGKKRKSLFRCVSKRNAGSENKVPWRSDLAKVSTDRHPRSVESANQHFHVLDFNDDVCLPPNKAMKSRSGGVYFYREFPQMMDLPGWRSNCSTLEIGKKKKDDLIFENAAAQGPSLSQIPSTPLRDPPNDLLVNKNIDVGEVDERQFVEALQLSFLMLGRAERRNFFRLFAFIESVVSNRGICPSGNKSKIDMIVEALVDVMTRTLEDRDMLEPVFEAIYKFFASNYRKVLEIPKLDLNVGSEQSTKYMGKVDLSFCKRVTNVEYNVQSNNHTKNALIQLLRTIVEDPTLSEKARREHLKKFEKGYPDIFYCFFPPSALPIETKDLRKRFLDSLRRFRDNLRQS